MLFSLDVALLAIYNTHSNVLNLTLSDNTRQFYLILEALSDAGVRHGLSRDVSTRHASQAMLVSFTFFLLFCKSISGSYLDILDSTFERSITVIKSIWK